MNRPLQGRVTRRSGRIPKSNTQPWVYRNAAASARTADKLQEEASVAKKLFDQLMQALDDKKTSLAKRNAKLTSDCPGNMNVNDPNAESGDENYPPIFFVEQWRTVAILAYEMIQNIQGDFKFDPFFVQNPLKRQESFYMAHRFLQDMHLVICLRKDGIDQGLSEYLYGICIAHQQLYGNTASFEYRVRGIVNSKHIADQILNDIRDTGKGNDTMEPVIAAAKSKEAEQSIPIEELNNVMSEMMTT